MGLCVRPGGGAWASVWAPAGPGVPRLLAALVALQLLSSVACHWLSLVACKMNAVRRGFLLPLYLASLALLPLFLTPVFLFLRRRQDAEGPGYAFSRYCQEEVHAGSRPGADDGFQRLVLDATAQLCALGLERPLQTGLLTGETPTLPLRAHITFKSSHYL